MQPTLISMDEFTQARVRRLARSQGGQQPLPFDRGTVKVFEPARELDARQVDHRRAMLEHLKRTAHRAN